MKRKILKISCIISIILYLIDTAAILFNAIAYKLCNPYGILVSILLLAIGYISFIIEPEDNPFLFIITYYIHDIGILLLEALSLVGAIRLIPINIYLSISWFVSSAMIYTEYKIVEEYTDENKK